MKSPLPMVLIGAATFGLMEFGGHGLRALLTSDRPGGGDARWLVPLFVTTARWEQYTMFSWLHLRDWLNQQLLVAPVVLPALAVLGVSRAASVDPRLTTTRPSTNLQSLQSRISTRLHVQSSILNLQSCSSPSPPPSTSSSPFSGTRTTAANGIGISSAWPRCPRPCCWWRRRRAYCVDVIWSPLWRR
ncbi:MAG: hypothetical protein R2838_01220 [Caldilineaceae bacterium]